LEAGLVQHRGQRLLMPVHSLALRIMPSPVRDGFGAFALEVLGKKVASLPEHSMTVAHAAPGKKRCQLGEVEPKGAL